LCKFDLAEILCYSRALTPQEEASVGGYLAAKYGIKTTYPVSLSKGGTTVSSSVGSGEIKLYATL
jgi:hypothetical protein